MDSNIPGVSEIQSACTQYAADIIVNQLKVTKSVEYEVKVSMESNSHNFILRSVTHGIIGCRNMLLHISKDYADAVSTCIQV